jgi:hypothetical protein
MERERTDVLAAVVAAAIAEQRGGPPHELVGVELGVARKKYGD